MVWLNPSGISDKAGNTLVSGGAPGLVIYGACWFACRSCASLLGCWMLADTVGPTTTGVVAVSSSPTNQTIHFKVTFVELNGVSGVTASNFDTSASTCPGTLTVDNVVAQGKSYLIDVSGMDPSTGCDVTVALTNLGTIVDGAGNALTGGAGSSASVTFGALSASL
jgi:hypothetical protein